MLGMTRCLARGLRCKWGASCIEALKKKLFSDEFLARHRVAPRDFTRGRKLPFTRLVVFLLNIVRSSLQNELDRFFQTLEGAALPVRRVTKSALTQARRKLRAEAFVELNHDAADFFYAHAPVRRWKGFRLVVFDGSTCRLPKTQRILERFGEARSGPGGACPMARASTAFDPLNEMILDARLEPYKTGELSLALAHVERCRAGDLVLMDRGYPAAWFLSLLASRGLHFCCRVPEGLYEATETFRASAAREAVIDLPPSAMSKDRYAAYGLPFEPLRVRIVRVATPGGDDVFLLTSLLDATRYSRATLGKLYRLRWSTEESYKRVKCRLEVENFSGLTPEAVEQDFHAKILVATLTAALSFAARREIEEPPRDGERRHPRRMNWTQAFGRMKHSIVLLFLDDNVEWIIERLTELFRALYDIHRPGRHFPRPARRKPRYHTAYKPIT